MKKQILLFDAEATSLYGETFAVGAIVADDNNNIIDRFELMSTDLSEQANDWVKENVLPHLKKMPTCKTGVELRTAFYEWYMKHKENCTFWSDVNYPVETNFLNAIVKDDEENRQWNMPYPLYDVANFVDVNIDRLDVDACKKLGMRKHHPSDDALSSYYTLIDSTGWKIFGHNIIKK